MFAVFTFGLTGTGTGIGTLVGIGICTGMGTAYTVVTVVVLAGEYDTIRGGGGELAMNWFDEL